MSRLSSSKEEYLDEVNLDDELELADEVNLDDELNLAGEVNLDDKLELSDEMNLDDELNLEEGVKLDDEPETAEKPASDDRAEITAEQSSEGESALADESGTDAKLVSEGEKNIAPEPETDFAEAYDIHETGNDSKTVQPDVPESHSDEGIGSMMDEEKDIKKDSDDAFAMLFNDSDEDNVTVLDGSDQAEASPQKEDQNSGVFDAGDLFGDLSDAFLDDVPDVSSGFSQNDQISDISDIFSDTLGVVNDVQGAQDQTLDDTLLMDLPDISELGEKKSGEQQQNDHKEEEKKGEKKGLLQKLFGNIVDEKSKAAYEKQLAEEAEAEEKRKKQEAAKFDENGKPVESEKEKKKREKAEKKAAKKAAKAEAKQAKKAAKQLAMKEIDEEVDEGRINPAGATIVFLFFITIGLLVIGGTGSFSYSVSMKQAANYFNSQKYTKAYNEVRGLEIKKKDQNLYDKIITVMYVNKQLNSYNNYYAIEKYPEALDSLLKGLKRYDKYIDLAEKLGIKSDMDYVRSQILTELMDVYDLSEEDAYAIINSDSKEEYVNQVVEVTATLQDSDVVRKEEKEE